MTMDKETIDKLHDFFTTFTTFTTALAWNHLFRFA